MFCEVVAYLSYGFELGDILVVSKPSGVKGKTEALKHSKQSHKSCIVLSELELGNRLSSLCNMNLA